VAATTDDICSFCLTFAIGAAIVAVFPCDAIAAGMGAFLLGFHAHPVCTLASELYAAILVAVVAAIVRIDSAAGNPVAPLVIVAAAVRSAVAVSETIARIEASVVSAPPTAVISTTAIVTPAATPDKTTPA
jgi:hypothetical protein